MRVRPLLPAACPIGPAPGLALVLVAAVAGAAPPRPVGGALPRPALKPDAAGYCQRTEFLGWSPDGAQAAYSESYCREPPADAAFDTLRLVARDGTVLRWFTGAESGASLSREARAKLLFEKPIRVAGPTAPDGRTVTATIEGETLAITLPGAPKLAGPLALPYPAWPFLKPPRVTAVYWAPDAHALALEVRATRREPSGAPLEVGTVYFAQVPSPPPGSSPGPATPDRR